MPEWVKWVLTFATGAAGLLFAPWANWGVEKRKIRLNNRKEVLRKFKGLVNSFGYETAIGMAPSEFGQIKEHLSKGLIALLETEPNRQLEFSDMQIKLLDELARLEKKWGLF